MNKHVKSVHLKEHICQVCKKGFGGKDKLRSHMLIHTGEKPFKCDKCNYAGTKGYNLEKHMWLVHKEVAKKEFQCNLCEKSLATSGRLERHIELVHNKKGTK